MDFLAAQLSTLKFIRNKSNYAKIAAQVQLKISQRVRFLTINEMERERA
jgi:hypothetical protein